MSTEVARTHAARSAAAGVPRSFGAALLGLAAALLLNSALGPLGAGLLDYPVSDSVLNQLVGLEVVTLALVVPWCVVAALRGLRGDPSSALLGFAPAAYTAYMFVQYVLGPEYVEYRPVSLLHLGIVTLSGGLTLWAWSLSDEAPLPPRSRRTERLCAAGMLGLAAFVALRYVGALVGAFTSAAIPEEFAASPTFYWSIHLLDLGVVVPATLVGAVALLRGADLGRRAMYGVTGWFALVPPSVAAMAVAMLVNDDPHASVGTVAILSVASLAFAGLAALVHRPLLLPQPDAYPGHPGTGIIGT